MSAKMPGNKDGNKKLWGVIHYHLGPESYNMGVILGWPYINVEPESCGGIFKSCGGKSQKLWQNLHSYLRPLVAVLGEWRSSRGYREL